jgi:hypothetical protein
MQHLEVSGAVVIYIGRTVSKGYNVVCVQKTAQMHMRTALHAFKNLHVPEARVMFRSLSSGITSAQRHRTPTQPDIHCMFWIFNYRFMSPTEPNYGAMTNESVTK